MQLFKSEGLSITIEINLQETDFLDVMFNLETDKYSPFRKPNDKPLYINTKSNHPPAITKELPKMISRRLTDLSCNEEEFRKSKGPYESALRNSGYDPTLKYLPGRARRKNRNRKVIWFNPPYNEYVKTNVGQKFLLLIQKHFPRTHRYSKIFSKNTIKLSYSCMPNMGSIIKQNNSNLLHPPADEDTSCNCRVKADCPVPDACRTRCSVYTATVEAERKEFVYHGTCDGIIKERISSHESSFRHRRHENDTELSKLVWKFKDSGTPYTIRWSIATKAHPYRCGTKRCDLCLSEKLIIARSKHQGMLNSRSELISKCRHKNKFSLCAVKS